jgi:non-heme Fe2+,alpha-ketoglutarate-dependent halogenase
MRPITITDDQISAYRAGGVLFPIAILGDDEVRRYRSEFEELESCFGGRVPEERGKQLHLHFRWAYDLATDPRILDAVEALLGADILVHGTSVFCKQAHDASYVSWHQDGYYMGLDRPEYVSVWLALTNSRADNGCLRVVPGTHHTELPHAERPAPGNMLGSGLTLACDVDESAACDVILEPGEISLHHVNAVHGSNPNVSDRRRIGFAVRYISTRVRQAMPHHRVILARGADRYGHFDHIDEVPSGSLAECIERQRLEHVRYQQIRRDWTASAASR